MERLLSRWRARTTVVIAGSMLCAIAGCNRDYALSTGGLVAAGERVQTFEPGYLGDWFDRSWERIEWKIERLADPDAYCLIHIDGDGKETYFSGQLVNIGDHHFLDVNCPTAAGEARAHMIMRLERCRGVEFCAVATSIGDKVRGAARLIAYRSLILFPMRGRYFTDRPGLLPVMDRARGVVLTASPRELREFLAAHADDKGLWHEMDQSIILKMKKPRE
jgi:hypothetical protein